MLYPRLSNNSCGLRVGRGTFIAHFGNISIDIISGVGDGPGTKFIIRLRGSEGRARVVIIDSIVVGEGEDLSFWGVVGASVVVMVDINYENKN